MINWEDKKKNEEVLDAIGEERSLVEAVVKRKTMIPAQRFTGRTARVIFVVSRVLLSTQVTIKHKNSTLFLYF